MRVSMEAVECAMADYRDSDGVARPLTGAALAELLEVKPQAVSDLMVAIRGGREISAARVGRLARCLGVTATSLRAVGAERERGECEPPMHADGRR